MSIAQEELDGLEAYLAATFTVAGIGPVSSVEAVIAQGLAECRADPVGYVTRTRRNRKRGGAVLRFMINRHPAARDLGPEDREELLRFASTGLPVGMSPEQKLKWHTRINRALPILKVVAQFTPAPYNFAVIGVIVLLIWVDENRLKPDLPQPTPAQLSVYADVMAALAA
jgi:hypothetical protein